MDLFSRRTVVVAEIGHNHQGSVELAERLVIEAAQAGADAVKLQFRDNLTLYTPEMLNRPYEHEHSFGRTYGEHRLALELSDDAVARLCRVAADHQILLFATAFDEPSVDRCLRFGFPLIKLASGALTDERLIRYVVSLKVPVILSTGGGTYREIDRAVSWLQGTPFALLHCTAAYPVMDWSELNLRCIPVMQARYQCPVGWSGHDNGIAMALLAWALGATIIEKHFTLNRALKGTDQAFSLEPAGLRKLVRDLHRAEVALGDGVKRVYDSERAPIAKMRRVPGLWQITGRIDDVFPRREACGGDGL